MDFSSQHSDIDLYTLIPVPTWKNSIYTVKGEFPIPMIMPILTTGDNNFALFTSVIEIQEMGLQQNSTYWK